MTKKRGKIHGINALLKSWWHLSFRERPQRPSLARVHYSGLAPAALESSCVRGWVLLQGKTAPAMGGKEGGGQPDTIIWHKLWHKREHQHLLQFMWTYTGLMDGSNTSYPPPDTESRKQCLVLPSTTLGQAHVAQKLKSTLTLVWDSGEFIFIAASLLCHTTQNPLHCSVSELPVSEGG